jgi:hypothetical protein
MTREQCNPETKFKPLKIGGVRTRPDDEISASAEFSGVERRDLQLLRDKLVSLDIQLLDFRIQG